MKKCCRCKNEKAPSCFGIDRSAKDGISRICKECNINKSKMHYENNKEKKRKYDADRYVEKIEEIKKRSRLYESINKEQVKKRKRKYYDDNISEILEKARRYRNSAEKGAHSAYCNKHNATMPDYYVRSLIKSMTGLSNGDISDKMIEAKRQILKAKRIIKEYEQNECKD